MIQNEPKLTGLAVKIQCTWANAFTEPVWNRGLCILSYDRPMMARNKDITGIIGTLTGNYAVSADGVVWVEATLKHSNRRPSGWFRESDIWHELKGTLVNPEDLKQKKSVNWLAWITGAVTVLKLMS